jgi:N-hydroxyarylamine O-acetyltransferase
MDTAGYLRRLDLDDPGPPSAEALNALHRAHVERVPYETIEIQVQRPTTVDPHEAAHRIVELRRGGYCYQLNGAFSLLLAALGYDVTWHRGGVQPPTEPDPVGATGNHLALTVANLPTDSDATGAWLVDAGLGDALHEPLPLVPGRYIQGPFTYELKPSTTEPGGWRFEHSPGMSFTGMDFRPQRATQEDFRARHEFLSTSPDSMFVRTFAVQRRDAHGVDVLTGCVLKRVPENGTKPITLNEPGDWLEVLNEVFGIELDRAERDVLWARVRAAHERWLRGQYSR